MKAYRTLAGFAALALLTACGQKSVENLNNTLSIQSNAYFMAFQNGGSDAEWQVRLRDNAEYNPVSRGITVDNDSLRFGLVFACPSTQQGQPHQVFLYLGVTSEIRELQHTCKKAEQARNLQRIYGSVRGLAENDGVANSGEMAMVALSSDVSVPAYEGYAAKTFLSRRDVLAYKGALDPATNRITPSRFYRRLNDDKTDVVRVDIDFDDEGLVADVSGNDLGQVSISGLQSGESVSSMVGFISKESTFLPLLEAGEAAFSYRATPRRRKSGDLFFDEGEGHQLLTTVSDSQGTPSRRLAVFFSGQQDIDIDVPALPPLQSSYTVSSQDQQGLLAVTSRLPSYYDANYGAGTLYAMRFNGKSSDNKAKLEWTVYMTQQWLGSDASLSLRLPSLVDLAGWTKDWEFKAATGLSSELSTYASRSSAGDILSFLQTGKFADGLSYAEILQSDTAP